MCEGVADVLGEPGFLRDAGELGLEPGFQRGDDRGGVLTTGGEADSGEDGSAAAGAKAPAKAKAKSTKAKGKAADEGAGSGSAEGEGDVAAQDGDTDKA